MAPVLVELGLSCRASVLFDHVLRQVVEGGPEEPVGYAVVERLVLVLQDDQRVDDKVLLGKAVELGLQREKVLLGLLVQEDFLGIRIRTGTGQLFRSQPVCQAGVAREVRAESLPEQRRVAPELDICVLLQ